MAKINDYLIVDAEKRTITVPETEKFFGVFSDRNVERKYFKCPKIVGDNVDLSTCEMFINYVSVGDTAGQYHCTDIAVVGEEITFSWLLSGNVFDTNKTGNIYFAVQAKTASGENVFNTTKAIGSVSETVQAIDFEEERYVDVILELLTRVDTLEKNGGGSGGGGNYILPRATSNALGGVKADNKGAEYTVPAKIGGDGKLYVPTYPAGGGSGGDVEPYVADFTGLTKLADTFAKKESITTNYASLGKDIENTVDNVLASKKPIKFIFAGNNIVFNPIRIDANGEKTRFVFAEDIPYKKSFFVYSIIIASNPYSVIMNKIRSDDLQSASANSLGGIKADLKGNDYTVPVKIGDDAKLYVPTYPTGGSSTGENHTYIADFTDLTDFDGILKRGGSLRKTCKTFTERQASVLEHIQNNPDDRIVFKFPQNVIIADAAKTRLADDLSDIFRFTWTRWANETTCVFFEMELYYNSPQHQEITFQRQYVNNSTGGTVDTQTVVQEVLKALPTWNGGEY